MHVFGIVLIVLGSLMALTTGLGWLGFHKIINTSELHGRFCDMVREKLQGKMNPDDSTIMYYTIKAKYIMEIAFFISLFVLITIGIVLL